MCTQTMAFACVQASLLEHCWRDTKWKGETGTVKTSCSNLHYFHVAKRPEGYRTNSRDMQAIIQISTAAA